LCGYLLNATCSLTGLCSEHITVLQVDFGLTLNRSNRLVNVAPGTNRLPTVYKIEPFHSTASTKARSTYMELSSIFTSSRQACFVAPLPDIQKWRSSPDCAVQHICRLHPISTMLAARFGGLSGSEGVTASRKSTISGSGSYNSNSSSVAVTPFGFKSRALPSFGIHRSPWISDQRGT
jgi:hypothetical protein